MENKLQKRYGLFTAICMVVGIVIGSGVFFKGQNVLQHTHGNVGLGVLAWIIGGLVIIICTYNFATLSTKYVKVNGVVDYSEVTVGKKYAYAMGWFVGTIYYPAMTSVLAWVSARYTLELFGSSDITGGLCMALGCFYLVLAYVLNILAPKLAGKFQVASTVIKMIPLVIMALVGVVVGLFNGKLGDAFAYEANVIDKVALGLSGEGPNLLAAVCACAFAYEGWIIATSINAELKEPKKHLPIALVLGSLIIVAVYIFYFLGLLGSASVTDVISKGASFAFTSMFGDVAGKILIAFIVVSCWGTLNGLMLGCSRSMYSLAVRDSGPRPDVFGEVSKSTNMPNNSGVFALLVCGFWFFYFYAANLNSKNIFGVFGFDSSELPIITIYTMYIPIFIMFIKKEGKNNVFKNIVMPVLAIIACVFMTFAAIYAHGIAPYQAAKAADTFAFPVLFYIIVYAVVMVVGLLFYKAKNKKEAAEVAE